MDALTKTILTIEGMSCQHCVRAVDAALRQIEGVGVVEVSIGRAVICSGALATRQIIADAIESEGFRVTGLVKE